MLWIRIGSGSIEFVVPDSGNLTYPLQKTEKFRNMFSRVKFSLWQCPGSVTFWYGPGFRSGSLNPYPDPSLLSLLQQKIICGGLSSVALKSFTWGKNNLDFSDQIFDFSRTGSVSRFRTKVLIRIGPIGQWLWSKIVYRYRPVWYHCAGKTPVPRPRLVCWSPAQA